MIHDTDIWDKIESYLEGSMDHEQRQHFEQLIAQDSEVASMVEASKITTEVVIMHEVLKLKVQMSQDLKKPSKSYGKYLWALLAAAVVSAGLYISIRPDEDKRTTTQKLVTKDTIVANTYIEDIQKEDLKDKTKTTTVLPKREKVKETASVNDAAPTLPTRDQSEERQDVVKDIHQHHEPLTAKAEEKKPVITPEVLKTDVCAGLKIDFDFTTSPSCIGAHTGQIHVKTESVKGGKAPYQFSLSGGAAFQAQNMTGLSAGSYSMYVRDAQNCIVLSSRQAIIGEISCIDSKNEFTYNPQYDPAWSIPYDQVKSAKHIKIFNKGGVEVYSAPVLSNHPSEWNGESNKGLTINSGQHIYIIEYTDGSLDKGTIIILR